MSICKYRKDIQEYLDNDHPLTDHLRNHIIICNECRSFLKLFENIKKNSKRDLNNKIKEIKDFDFSFMKTNRNQDKDERKKYNSINNKYNKYLTIAACVCIIFFSAYFIFTYFYNQHKLNQFIVNENKKYVSGLFENNIADETLPVDNNSISNDVEDEDSEIEYYKVDSGWFEGVGLVEEIMGEFAFNAEYDE